MRLNFVLISLLIIVICGIVMSTALYDPIALETYSPNTSQYNQSDSYVGLIQNMTGAYDVAEDSYDEIQNKTMAETEFNFEDIGSGIGSAIKIPGKLLNLETAYSLLMGAGAIIGIPPLITASVLIIIFIAIIFAIISAIMRWKT